MIGIYIFTTAILTLAWGVLSESFSLFTLLTGLLVSISCVIFAVRYLPLYKAEGISPLRLIFYPFILIGQIYMSAISNVKNILTDSYADIITVKTGLKSEFLRVLLSHSITLTPGTVSLDLKEHEVVVLCLKRRNESASREASSRSAISRMEARLLKAQAVPKKK